MNCSHNYHDLRVRGRNTKVSEQSANLCSANPSLWHPSLPPFLSLSLSLSFRLPPGSLPAFFSQPLAYHPFEASSHPHPRHGGDTFQRGTILPTQGSRKFLSRSRNCNYPLGYARYAASRCAREKPTFRSVAPAETSASLPYDRIMMNLASIFCKKFNKIAEANSRDFMINEDYL